MNRRTIAALALPIAGALGLATALGAAAIDVDKAPTSYLVGPETGLIGPMSVAVDSQGMRYVSNGFGKGIRVYAPNASGNAAPVRAIEGPATLIKNSDGIAVDADGYVYVSDTNGAGTAKILVFAPDASGNVAPARVIAGSNTQLSWPRQLAVDDVGRLYVADSAADAIAVFAPGASGNISPLRRIVGDATMLGYPRGIALSRENAVSVTNYDNDSITTYAPGASGNVAPIRTITGTATGVDGPWTLASDTHDNLYAINLTDASAVNVFAPSADGDVAPTVRLAGPETDLAGDDHSGIAVDASGNVLVTAFTSRMLLTYAPLLTPSSAVRALKVTGPSSAAKRTVTWKPPASVGGGEVTGYQVTVKAQGKTLLSKKLGAGTLKLVLKKAQLKVGKDTVTVRARNPYGLSPKQSVTVKVTR